jgi:very-short-patch-repair endonuclease
MTLSEILLWQQIKGKQLFGYDFHRQKPIDEYVVDFYCPRLKLVLEIDGDSHEGKEEAERPYILLHELHERNLMAKGWMYDKTHEDSSKIEYYCRQHPNELHLELAKEGWT